MPPQGQELHGERSEMAWIEKRDNGWLVRWRDEDRKTRSRRFRDEAHADTFLREKESQELARDLPRLTREAWERGEMTDAAYRFATGPQNLF